MYTSEISFCYQFRSDDDTEALNKFKEMKQGKRIYKVVENKVVTFKKSDFTTDIP